MGKTSGSALTTISGTYSFAWDSVLVTYSFGSFLFNKGFGAVTEFVPPPMQKQIRDQYDSAWMQIDSVRIQNNIPTFKQLKADAWKLYSKQVEPVVTGFWQNVKQLLGAKPQEVVKGIIDQFEKEYPECKGTLPKDLFDFMWVWLLLYYTVIAYIFLPILNCFCCGACSKRKSPE